MTKRFTLEEEEIEETQSGRWTRFKEFIGLGSYEDEEEEELEPTPSRRKGQILRLQSGRTHQIHKISIRSLEDARYAADMLKERRPVILNLEQSDEETARRAIDFVSGATYALDGYFERVGERVFLFTPSNVLIATEENSEFSTSQGLYMNAQ
ncbi:MAG TPA: cell division protein SepF [Armatimonadetes bacterium]|jgi:cell division inhibitor SepF|nr:cell division protein SepF [Armatimonadota bacterium]